MEIVEFFTCKNQKHWLEEIKKSDWDVGQYLYEILETKKFKRLLGAASLLFLLTDGDKLISFCSYTNLDDIQPTDLSPWIGFVYTFPEYRGHKYIKILFDRIEAIATIMQKEFVYISTAAEGLYEKYGYEFYKIMKDVHGEDSRVYRKNLKADYGSKDLRLKIGNEEKAKIVEAARDGVDMTAPCGFSCNHCCFGQWCGGCRSTFCCCSYAKICDHANCPNMICVTEKNIEGCWMCSELETCKKGFYGQTGKDGEVCKANALFIKKYGKENHQKILNKIHENHSFDEMQKIMPETEKGALEFFEKVFKEL